jgi:energy-coupling factor transport system ATP-binding protein
LINEVEPRTIHVWYGRGMPRPYLLPNHIVTIEITNLSYTYARRDTPALRDISLTFRAGEIALIVGKSGSGKTTLIRCINGLIPRSYTQGTLSGQIRCFGESTGGMSLAQLARRVGTVMQDPDKQIVATRVFYEIAFGLENLGLPREEIIARVNESATQLKIDHLLERDVHSLSGGEQQRVVIAAVLAMRPQALLLDEPLASLDVPSANNALVLFRELADQGIAVIMVEHRIEAALRIAPELCVALDEGQVVFQGNAAEFTKTQDARRETVEERHVLRPVSTIASRHPLFSFRDVHFAYPEAEREQVAGVSLDVRAGDVIALIGPNGAGKSTLARLAIGVLRPSSGRVLIGDVDAEIRTVAQIVKDVGYVFQNPAVMLFANTLRDELSFGPRNVGLPQTEIDHNIARAMQIVGLGDIPLDRSPFSLSYGQQKRVAAASVLAMSPRVLILDEPTAGLDDDTADDLLQRLLVSEDAPEALVLVTHDFGLARRYANRAVVLARGAVVADGGVGVLDDAAVMQQAGLWVNV